MAIAEVLRRRLGGSALAALTTFALLSGVSAQSTDRSQPSRAPRAGREPRQCRQFREGPYFLLLCGARSYRCGHGVRGDGLVRRAAAPDNKFRPLQRQRHSRLATTPWYSRWRNTRAGRGPFDCYTMLSEDRGAGARRSRESRTGRSNSIVFGHKVRGGRLTCARHPWDIFKVTRCCRVVGGSRVLFSFGYGSNYLRR